LRLGLAALGGGALLLLSGAAGAEIYQWTDESGRTHFTQDLSKVPARYRGAAKNRSDEPTRSKVQTFESTPPASVAPSAGSSRSQGGKDEIHRIRVQRAGTSMVVNVRLNNSITAPFLIDTGATDVVVPRSVAEQLGLELGPGVRTKRYSTANGIVEQAAVMLRSVQLGGAKVEDVPASVSDSMQIGLLGLSFFNHFTYNVDAAAGIVTLQRNRMASTGLIRGGRSEAQWRSEFGQIDARIGWAEREYASKAESKARTRRRLLQEIEELERQRLALESEAAAARVPMSWRY
jgi:clan AA aspartic protease (TIGR02281 family)